MDSNLPAFDFTVCRVAPQVELIGGGFATNVLPHANKTIGKWPTDNRPYDDVFWWYFSPKIVPSLEAMGSALEWLAEQSRMMIVRGQVKPGIDPNTRARRRYADPDESTNSFLPVARCWMAMDFDGLLVPAGLGAGDKVAEAGAFARALLPREFHDVRMIVSVTSSTGLAKNLGVGPDGEDLARLRLFCLLDQPIADEDLRDWTKGFAYESRIALDYVVTGTVQPVYTARPFFVGLDDPVPKDRRVAILDGRSERVALALDHYCDVTAFRHFQQRQARRRSGRDWRQILDYELGDIDQYHEVIWRALGMAIKAGDATEDEIIKYVLAAVAKKADMARQLHYDYRYLHQCIRAFERKDAARKKARG
jgi:hypothetical protein